MSERSLLFISPHFPPDSSAGTHRARILAPHLANHGWRPIVLTVDRESVEGEIDEELATTVDAGVEVVRVNAWSPRVTRRAGFGDLGLRAYHPMRRAALQLVRERRIDATLVTTYPTYPALIGAALKRSMRVPFVLDLQDPWVGAWGKDVGPGGSPDLRSRASRAVAVRLERRAAAAANALMSVTARTLADVVSRVPAAAGLPQLETPIGWCPEDWARVRVDRQRNPLFQPGDGYFHICAVGTQLPTAIHGLRSFLAAIECVARDAGSRARLRVWFVGTSNERRADAPHVVRPLAEALGLEDIVFEHAPRFAYFDALRVLRDADTVLVLGSGEPHYTPSRVFPALASRRPVIARLHPDSPAWPLLARAGRTRPVELIAHAGHDEDQVDAFVTALRNRLDAPRSERADDDEVLAPFSGDGLARRVASFLDKVCAA